MTRAGRHRRWSGWLLALALCDLLAVDGLAQVALQRDRPPSSSAAPPVAGAATAIGGAVPSAPDVARAVAPDVAVAPSAPAVAPEVAVAPSAPAVAPEVAVAPSAPAVAAPVAAPAAPDIAPAAPDIAPAAPDIAPAPAPAPSAPTVIYFERGDVEFALGGAWRSFVAAAAAHPDTAIEISGHADERGDGPANLALSVRRAEAVAEALVAAGIDRSRLRPAGFGEAQPRVQGHDSRALRRNRRVELVLAEVAP